MGVVATESSTDQRFLLVLVISKGLNSWMCSETFYKDVARPQKTHRTCFSMYGLVKLTVGWITAVGVDSSFTLTQGPSC